MLSDLTEKNSLFDGLHIFDAITFILLVEVKNGQWTDARTCDRLPLG